MSIIKAEYYQPKVDNPQSESDFDKVYFETSADQVIGLPENYVAIAQGAGNVEKVLTVDSNGNVVPMDAPSGIDVGMIVPYAGAGDIPVGFLLCNGASVGVATYPALFEVIGYTYGGEGDYFNLPNLIDKFIEGANTVGVMGGEATHKLTVNEMPTHGHNINIWNANTTDYTAQGWNTTGTAKTNVTSGGRLPNGHVAWQSASFKTAGNGGLGDVAGASSAVGGGGAHNNLPPFLTMRYIIKAFAGASASSTDLEITNVANDVLGLAGRTDVVASGSNYIRYASGLQICWGGRNLTADTIMTYPVPFKSAPTVATSGTSLKTVSLKDPIDGTQVQFVCNSYSCYVRYIAIGYWK